MARVEVWLGATMILQAAVITAAGDSRSWSTTQRAAFSNDVLKSINDLRQKLNTKPLKLDPDTTDKGLNGLAMMYAVLWRGGPDPLPLQEDENWVQEVSAKSGKKFNELEQLYRGALLYFDSNPAHLSGNALIMLAETRAITKPTEANFANDGDLTSSDSYTCNTLRKLLWTSAETIGVYAAWDEDQARQSYVIVFDNAFAQKDSFSKLSQEATVYLAKLDCLHLSTDKIHRTPVLDELAKEVFEDATKAKGAWTADQAKKFREEVVLGINALRSKQLGGTELTLDDDLTKAANIFATHWGKNNGNEVKADTAWVIQTLKETKIKGEEVLKTIVNGAILFQHNADTVGKHLKPDIFVQLLKDVDPMSPLLGSIKHEFNSDGGDDTDRDGKLEVYCHRLKQLLWVPSAKIGLGIFFHVNWKTMFFVLFVDPARKRLEKERDRFTPKAVAFLQAKGNECRMDFVAEQTEQFAKGVFDEVVGLRTAFGIAAADKRPLKETPALMKQAKVAAKAWAHNHGPIDVSTLPKGFILFAKRRQSRKHENIGDTKPHWDENGFVLDYKLEAKSKDFIKRLLDADRLGLPLPVTKQSPGPVSLTAAAPTAIRLSQILCKEATEFGFGEATYVYNTSPYDAELTQYFVLLFNAQCASLPKITDKNAIAELKANGWENGAGDMWWFKGDLNKLRLLANKKQ